MKWQQLADEVERIGRTPGVITCTLVDAATGMTCYASGGRPDLEPLAEAARDYWRLHLRNDNLFNGLGPMVGIIVLHEEGVINVMPCSADFVLVTLARRNTVNFSSWPTRLQRLRTTLGAIDTPA